MSNQTYSDYSPELDDERVSAQNGRYKAGRWSVSFILVTVHLRLRDSTVYLT